MEMDDGQAGYYSDLLNRVDNTLNQSHSAYGGEHAEDETTSSATAWFGGRDRTIHFHVSPPPASSALNPSPIRRRTRSGAPKTRCQAKLAASSPASSSRLPALSPSR